MTRHPRMGAVEQPEVPLREREWNERATADDRENAGVYVLLCVNVCGLHKKQCANPTPSGAKSIHN
jgi:hypothetical protein